MKHVYFLFSIFLLFLNSCKNDDDSPKNPLDQLPPVTQTGEQTFGCLINGEAFIPDSFGSGRPSAFYQFVDNSYTMVIRASKKNESPIRSIAVSALDIEGLFEGKFELISENSGNFYGIYLIGGGITLDATTKDNKPGTLTITNFDEENGIISGTFEFTVLDNEGNEINITEGRFDLEYTN